MNEWKSRESCQSMIWASLNYKKPAFSHYLRHIRCHCWLTMVGNWKIIQEKNDCWPHSTCVKKTSSYTQVLGSYWSDRKCPRKGGSMNQTVRQTFLGSILCLTPAGQNFPTPSGKPRLASSSSHYGISVSTLPGEVCKEIAQEKGNRFSRMFYSFSALNRKQHNRTFDIVWFIRIVSRVKGWTRKSHLSVEKTQWQGRLSQEWRHILGWGIKHHYVLA